MATVTPNRLVTADELLAMHGRWRGELIRGVLHEMNPPGGQHGKISARIGRLLDEYGDVGGGDAFGETGFVLESGPDTVRAPDAAWVTAEHAARVGDSPRYWPGAPDLAVEVVSPNDTYAYVHEKALLWLAHGCGLVLVVDPTSATVTRYLPPGELVVFSGEQVVDCVPVAPGFAPTAAVLLRR